MSLAGQENFRGRVAEVIKLANEKTTGPREMISALSDNNINEYLTEKKSKENIISDERTNSKYDFSDLGIGR